MMRAILRNCLAAALPLALSVAAAAASAAPASIALPGDWMFPESLTASPDGTLFVGSVGTGGVTRVNPNTGRSEAWIRPGAFGSRSVYGVLADERSNTLWVCSNDLSMPEVNIPGTDKGGVLKGFDLQTGAGKISVHLPGTRPFCNDIAVGPDGAAYVTDSNAPQILRLPRGGQEFEVWATAPKFPPPAGGGLGLDGLAFDGDGNLYVDTYAQGQLFRVDVAQGKPRRVTQVKPSRQLQFPDAIRPLGRHDFLLIEGAGRLDLIHVKGNTATIETLEDGYVGATSVVTVGQTAWVSEGQLSYLSGSGRQGDRPKLPFHIYSVTLPTRN